MGGAIIGVGAALVLNQTAGYDVALTTTAVGLPAALILARALGGPLTPEMMGRDERNLARNIKLGGIAVGLIAAVSLGYLMGNLLNGVGIAVALLIVAGPRWGLIVDERMGRAYDKSATNAFAVFSVGAAYLGFYQGFRHPGEVTVGSFVALTWVSWGVLLASWVYYYFVSGD